MAGSSRSDSPDDARTAAQAAEEKAAAERASAALAAAKAAETEAAVARAAAAQLNAAQTAAIQLAESKVAEARAVAAQIQAPAGLESKSEPKLRHEFVGMMFAVAIGEVGVQTAALVQAGHWVHFLPAYSHLFLTAIVIAASWVGWTLSPSPGAREDVRSVFQWGFLVLLLDVFLVVVYFILAKTVDIKEAEGLTLRASARPETFWILVIFVTYFIWDTVTKVIIYFFEKRTESWFRSYGARMLPTIICLALLRAVKPLLESADAPHVLTADLALVSLVMLFRALKGLTDALTKLKVRKTPPILWTVFCLCGFGLGALWTSSSYPLPVKVVREILTEPSKPIVDLGKPTPESHPAETNH